jgi:hypothetical protein
MAPGSAPPASHARKHFQAVAPGSAPTILLLEQSKECVGEAEVDGMWLRRERQKSSTNRRKKSSNKNNNKSTRLRGIRHALLCSIPPVHKQACRDQPRSARHLLCWNPRLPLPVILLLGACVLMGPTGPHIALNSWECRGGSKVNGDGSGWEMKLLVQKLFVRGGINAN